MPHTDSLCLYQETSLFLFLQAESQTWEYRWEETLSTIPLTSAHIPRNVLHQANSGGLFFIFINKVLGKVAFQKTCYVWEKRFLIVTEKDVFYWMTGWLRPPVPSKSYWLRSVNTTCVVKHLCSCDLLSLLRLGECPGLVSQVLNVGTVSSWGWGRGELDYRGKMWHHWQPCDFGRSSQSQVRDTVWTLEKAKNSFSFGVSIRFTTIGALISV